MSTHVNTTIELQGDPEEIKELIEEISIGGNEYDLTLVKPLPGELEELDNMFTDSPEPHQNWDVMLAHGQISQERYEYLCEKQRKDYEIAQKNLATYGYKDWYSWTVDNWGTKWVDTYDFENNDPTDITIKVKSAWGPPVELIKALTEKFPSLKALVTYISDGNDTAGGVVIIEGKCLFDETFTFYQDDIPEHLMPQYKQLHQELDAGQDRYTELAELTGEWIDHIINITTEAYNEIVKDKS